jgi:transposase
MVTQEYTYAYAAVDVLTGQMDSLILPYVNGDCMQLFIDEVASRNPDDHIVMVLDGAGWHKGIKQPPNMRLVKLPPYSPELNPVEHVWDEVREKYFANRVFESLQALEDHLEMALREMEQASERVCSIVSWPWIKNSLMN